METEAVSTIQIVSLTAHLAGTRGSVEAVSLLPGSLDQPVFCTVQLVAVGAEPAHALPFQLLSKRSEARIAAASTRFDQCKGSVNGELSI